MGDPGLAVANSPANKRIRAPRGRGIETDAVPLQNDVLREEGLELVRERPVAVLEARPEQPDLRRRDGREVDPLQRVEDVDALEDRVHGSGLRPYDARPRATAAGVRTKDDATAGLAAGQDRAQHGELVRTFGDDFAAGDNPDRGASVDRHVPDELDR